VSYLNLLDLQLLNFPWAYTISQKVLPDFHTLSSPGYLEISHVKGFGSWTIWIQNANSRQLIGFQFECSTDISIILASTTGTLFASAHTLFASITYILILHRILGTKHYYAYADVFFRSLHGACLYRDTSMCHHFYGWPHAFVSHPVHCFQHVWKLLAVTFVNVSVRRNAWENFECLATFLVNIFR